MFCDFFLLNKTINIEIEIGWSGGGVGRVREGGGELNHFAFMASTRNNPRLLPTPQFQLHSAFPIFSLESDFGDFWMRSTLCQT